MGRCVRPLTAWQTEGGDIVFAERGKIRRELTLPCGQCIECKLERSRQWGVRCMHEASLHDENCFLTLTYDDAHVPLSLEYTHFQRFLKRLRFRVGVPIRFYMCGEYGERFKRPHFHSLIFGWRPADLVLFSTRDDIRLYTSSFLSEIWTDGFASVGELTFESACYVARYCTKKVTGPLADSHYWRTDLVTGECREVTPEFGHMSLKPGIGSGWIDKYVTDVYPNDAVYNGSVPGRPPRFYDKRLAILDPDTAEFMEAVRYKKALASSIDSTVDRLRAREVCTRARLAFKYRNLE